MESADYWRGREDQAAKERTTLDKASIAVFVGGMVLLGVVFWLVPSYFEARTYSRLTGANVTMWDAMWVDLRVQESIPGGRNVQ